jgi:8-oxo-dGTP pyrophosphatase MutT (NUDIX family)
MTVVFENYADKRLKLGDYVYLYDPDNNQVIANYWTDSKVADPTSCYDNRYYPLGGGREEGETSLECLVREVGEETNGRVNLCDKPVELLYHARCFSRETFQYGQDCPRLFGKSMRIYFAQFSKRTLPNFENLEIDGSTWKYEWFDATILLLGNQPIRHLVSKIISFVDTFLYVDTSYQPFFDVVISLSESSMERLEIASLIKETYKISNLDRKTSHLKSKLNACSTPKEGR